MIIRNYIPEKDGDEVRELADKHKLNVPIDSKIIVAESNTGKIEGFVSIRPVMFIEPMVSDNPITAVKLWNYVEKKMKDGGIKVIRCFAEPKHEKTYKKLKFYRVFKKMLALEKNFYSEV